MWLSTTAIYARNMTTEEWRAVPGWEGMYEVSSHGRVRSLDRITTKGQRVKGKTLSSKVGPNGYPLIGLYRASQRTAKTVHQLVMEAFEGPRPEGLEVCHRNGDGSDNRKANLYYGTSSDNRRDRVAHGTDPNASRTHCAKGHAFDEDNTYMRPGGGRRCRACRRVEKE
jgi:hypothetical protein